MLALPGSAYLYQGEELGLPDVTDLPDEVRQDPSFFRASGQDGYRDGCRVPIPWSGAEPPYGFGPVPGGPSWLPQPKTWAELSVEAQTGDPDSTLELYRSALALRREHPALGAGTDTGTGLTWLDAPPGVLVFHRASRASRADHASGPNRPSGTGTGFVCTVNLTAAPVTLPAPGRPLLSSEAASVPTSVPTSVTTSGSASADKSAPTAAAQVTLPADTTMWWAV
jgi:alpha-glucosidase